MIISKLQQFIIFNCDQSEITIPSSLSSKISKIIQVRQPTGSSILTFAPDAPIPQLNKLTPNTIYLITSVPEQLPYDIPGVVDPLTYCLNANVNLETQNYSGGFLKFKKDGEELILEVENSSMVLSAKYLKAKAKKGYKAYNDPWSFYLDEIELVEDMPSGYYNTKPSIIQQQLNNTQESYVNVFFDLSLFEKIENRGILVCGNPLYWDCYKEIDNQTNESYLMGYCAGDCPAGYFKGLDELGFREICIPIQDSDSDLNYDSDIDYGDLFDSDGNFILDLDSDLNEDDYKYRDSDSDIDFDSDDLGLDLSNVIFDPIVFDFNQSLEYNLNLINSIPDDFNNIQIPTLTEIEIINIRLRDPGISNEERQYLTYKLERILNG